MAHYTEVEIPFCGRKLIAVIQDDKPYVAAKSICEGIGLKWARQYQKIKQNSKFSCLHMWITGADKKRYKTLCIPLRKLNGWLFSINPEKCREDIRHNIAVYQEECFEVLYNYFNHGGAINPQASSQQLLTLRAQLDYYKQFAPDVAYGALSKVNSRERKFLHKGYFQSPPRKPEEVKRATQQVFDFINNN